MLLICFSSIAFSQVSPVKDDLHLLKTEEVAKLNKKLAAHKNHIGIVIKHSESIEEDALNYGRGPNGVDVVVWYSPAHTDKEGTKQGSKVRIEVGTYKEGDLTDMSSNEIILANVQLLKDKKYFEFFDKVTDGIYQKLNEAPVADSTEAEVIATIVIVILIILWIILFFICPDCALFLLYLIPMFSKGGSSGSFSGGGSTWKD